MPKANHPVGVVLSTVTDAPPAELVEIAQLAESQGFSSVYVNEGRGDSLACAEAIALGTSTLKVGTNIANIYFRHPYLAAQTARTIAELSEGRLILGLGMSHRAMLASLGIEMGDARAKLRDYAAFVVEALAGRAGKGFLAPPASRYPVPVLVAGNTVESAAIAGEVGDGLMPFLSPLSYLTKLVEASREAATRAGRDANGLQCVISIPTFFSDDLDAARSAARYNLAFFAELPNYRRQWRRAGYKAAMDQIQSILAAGGKRRDAAAIVPDELVDDVCVFGSAANCRAQLAAFHAAGADEPVIAVSPVNEERLPATRKALAALGTT